jgi:hypothetical protein
MPEPPVRRSGSIAGMDRSSFAGALAGLLLLACGSSGPAPRSPGKGGGTGGKATAGHGRAPHRG